MKTRVVRYWNIELGDYLYKVEEYVQAEKELQLGDWTRIGWVATRTIPVGEWYWQWVVGGLDRHQAEKVAEVRANCGLLEISDVVAEFGE